MTNNLPSTELTHSKMANIQSFLISRKRKNDGEIPVQFQKLPTSNLSAMLCDCFASSLSLEFSFVGMTTERVIKNHKKKQPQMKFAAALY